MSKIAREITKEISVEQSPMNTQTIDRVCATIDRHLAPTLALMERLAKNLRKQSGPSCHGNCPPCKALDDYKVWEKEQG